MFKTDIDAWRVSLLLSLGCAAACGGESAEVIGCENAEPSPDNPSLMRCDNGIVYRPAPEDCTGECVPPAFNFPSGFDDRCTSGADCATGSLCIATFESPGEGELCEETRLSSHFACQSRADACGSHEQCGASERCVLGNAGRYCRDFDSYCGVPLQ